MNLSLPQQFWTKLFIVLNSCFVIFGIVLLALGIKGLETLNRFGTILTGIIPPIIPIAIFIGCLILIGTTIGYIGLWKPKKFIVILHIACLCLAVIIEIAIATATATTGEKFQTAANHSVLQAVKQFYSNPYCQVEMDKLQRNGCVEAFSDYAQHYIVALITMCFVFGIITQNTLSKYTTILNTPISAIIPTILFTGCFGLIAALIGYIGLWKPMNSIALMHIISLCIVTLIEIGIATTSAVMYDQFKCCGAESYLDYRKLGLNIPFSCIIGYLVYARDCNRPVSYWHMCILSVLT
uniref:25 kDa integral membrane protein n=1 Tax=Schistosoma haematobium TaxID=6185 RepID=A0A094ZPK1_SCHHA